MTEPPELNVRLRLRRHEPCQSVVRVQFEECQVLMLLSNDLSKEELARNGEGTLPEIHQSKVGIFLYFEMKKEWGRERPQPLR